MGMYDQPDSIFAGKIGPGQEGPLARAAGPIVGGAGYGMFGQQQGPAS